MTPRTGTDGAWHPAFEACTDGIALTEGDRLARVTERYATLHGAADAASLAGTPWRDRVAPADRERLAGEVLAGLAAGERWEGSVRSRRVDGTTAACDLALYRADRATVVWTVRPADDATTRESPDHAAEPARSYRTLVENFPNGAVALFDTDLRYTVVEGGIFDRVDLDAADMEGEPLEEVHSEQFRHAYLEHYRAALEGDRRAFDFEYGDRVFRAHVIPVRDASGRVVSGLSMTQEITERVRWERRLERRRAELETLTRVNELVLETARELVDPRTEAETYRTVCERLAASELYEFAWIGERTLGDGIEVRAQAGDGGDYLEEVTITADDTPTGRGPAGTALRTGEVQVTRVDAPAFDPWADSARARGFESVAAVPLRHGRTVYGVLAVYAARADAFSDREATSFAVLGETVGFVVNALRRRDLLLADRAVQLELRVADPDSLPLAVSGDRDCRLTLEGHVHRDGRWHLYCGVDGAAPEAVAAAAADVPGVEDCRSLGDWGDGHRLEFVTGRAPLLSRIDDVGGTVTAFVADGGTGRLVVEVPDTADVRSTLAHLGAADPEVELLARRDRDRSPGRSGVPGDLLDRLTDRQREALEAAYRSGYFRWPRESSAEEVAASLGVSRPTFQAHLRKAHQRLLGGVLE